jgi:ribosomal protein L31E
VLAVALSPHCEPLRRALGTHAHPRTSHLFHRGFKKRAPRAVQEIKKFAAKVSERPDPRCL